MDSNAGATAFTFADMKHLMTAVALTLMATITGVEPSRPNIIVVLADDLGYDALACNGGAISPTPNLDKMARDGMRFTNCHVQPVCTPTRNELMTGRGNRRNYVGFGDIDRNERTFGHVLHDAGYATAVAGKWQLGSKTTGPRDAGFDNCLLREMDGGFGRYWGGNLWIDGAQQPIDANSYAPDVQLQWALNWINDQRTKSQSTPFFMYITSTLTHDPFVATPGRWTAGAPLSAAEMGSIDRDTGSQHAGAMVAQLDRQMGALMEFLGRPEDNIAANTLVLFLGDNGQSLPLPLADGTTVPKGKGYTTNYGTHVPCIAWWPGMIGAPGAKVVADDLVSATDVLPTLASIAGVTFTPSDPVLDGFNLAPRLKNTNLSSPRTSIYHWYSETNQLPIIWVHDRRWKLYADGRLFDTVADPNELNPVAAGVEANAARSRLQSELDIQSLIPEPKQAWQHGAEIVFRRGLNPIGDGKTDSINGTVAGTTISLTYTIENAGSSALTIGAATIVSTSNCSAIITTAPASQVGYGEATALVLSVTPASAGAWSCQVSFATNDANENPTNWTASGTATSGGVASPEIAVTRSASAIADGSNDTVSGLVGMTMSTVTYTIANSGNAALTISNVTLGSPVNCIATVTTAPASVVTAGGVATLAIAVTPTSAGAWSCPVSFATNDSDENPTDWTVSGTAVSTAAPEITVTRASAGVVDDSTDAIPDLVAGTVTYLITNSGTATLTIGRANLRNPVNCVAIVTGIPATSVAAGGSTTLTIQVTPAATGIWACSVSFATNDSDEHPTNWRMSGTTKASSAPAVATRSSAPNAVSGREAESGAGSGCGLGSALAGLVGMLLALRGSAPLLARRGERR